MLVNRENKNRENFYERTLELEDVPPLLFQDLCGSPPCTSFAAWRTLTAKGSWRRSSSWFSSEAMVKGYQAYRDSWATVLSEEMSCLREVGN